MYKTLLLFVLGTTCLIAQSIKAQEYVPLDISEVKFSATASFPSTDKIPVPKLPPLKPLVQKRQETDNEFLTRVRIATIKRQAETFPIQQKYRADVLRRNNMASSSKNEFYVLVDKYNKKLKKFRDFLDYDAKIHGHAPVSQNYPQIEDVNLTFDDSLQDPNLNDPYIPLLTSYDKKRYSSKQDDIIKLIKKTKKRYPDYKTWLFVISIEDYKSADKVLFASRTSDAIIKGFQKKIGVPKRHTIVIKNREATGKNILAVLEALIKRVQPDDSIYFYFVGHAMSGPSGRNFILAYDGSVDMMDMKGLVGMNHLYNTFQRSKAGRTFAFIDASFTGVSDNIPLKKGEIYTSPVKKTKYHKRLNIINATKRDQMVNAYFAKGYRLFSYFLIKGALSTKKQDAGEMFDTLQEKIKKASMEYGPEYEQEPEFFGYRNLAMQK